MFWLYKQLHVVDCTMPSIRAQEHLFNIIILWGTMGQLTEQCELVILISTELLFNHHLYSYFWLFDYWSVAYSSCKGKQGYPPKNTVTTFSPIWVNAPMSYDITTTCEGSGFDELRGKWDKDLEILSWLDQCFRLLLVFLIFVTTWLTIDARINRFLHATYPIWWFHNVKKCTFFWSCCLPWFISKRARL